MCCYEKLILSQRDLKNCLKERLKIEESRRRVDSKSSIKNLKDKERVFNSYEAIKLANEVISEENFLGKTSVCINGFNGVGKKSAAGSE